MTYSIRWDEKSREFLRKIEKDDAQRIIRKVNSIVDDPHHYLETLVGFKFFKLRIGDFRALVDINSQTLTLSVLFIGHRRDVYKYIQREDI